MKRLLFVDDDPLILEVLRGGVTGSLEWQAEFVTTAEEAQRLLDRQPCDVVLTDIHLVGMGGTQLLLHVKAKYPHVVRIAFSGCAHPDTVLKTLEVAHQFVPKPLTLDLIQSVVQRCCDLQDRLASTKLQQLVTGIRSLPSMPALYQELLTAMDSSTTSVDAVAKIIAKDMAMLSKVLQIVNSAYFGLRRTISSATQAVSLLGLDRIKALTLGLKVFEQFDRSVRLPLSLESLWEHGLRTAMLARDIARCEGAGPIAVEGAFMAGLLHDIGLLVLASNFPDRYAETLRIAEDRHLGGPQAEEEVFGTSHGTIGGYLLSLWGVSDSVVEAVTYHHEPAGRHGERFRLLTAVHVANAHDAAAGDNVLATADRTGLDHEYLGSCELTDRLPAWLDIARSRLVQ